MSALAVIQPAPNLERLIALAVNAVQSENTRRAYGSALRQFVAWWAANGQPALSRESCHAYRTALQQSGAKPGRINQALQAIAKLATEAEACGAISYAALASIQSIERIKQRGAPAGNWLDEAQIRELLDSPARGMHFPLMGGLASIRDRAALFLLVGTSIRRAEIARVRVEQFCQREGRWVLLDLSCKAGKLRTVPVADWAADAILAWIAAARLTTGPLLFAIEKHNTFTDRPLTASGLYWLLTKRYGAFKVSPQDLRRSIARIMRANGAPWEAIQQQLGHSNLTVTQRYVRPMTLLKKGDAGVDYWQPTATTS